MKTDHHPDPNVKAKMEWDSKPARAGTMRAGDPLGTFREKLVVVDTGEERSAVDVFEDAFKDWHTLLGDWGFVEGTHVPALTSER